MANPILILLDYIERTIGDLNNGLTRKSLRKTKTAFDKLTELSSYLKELLDEEFVEENFEAFDRHMGFIETFYRKKDFEWMRNNLDDIRKIDFPNIRKKIYDLPTEGTTHRKKFTQSTDKIFIVHGKDHKPLKELKNMLKGFGLNPIVLHEKASGSRTIVEKLEKYSDVGYAFVILTPDDPIVYLKETALGELLQNRKPRARQNVILEFGYFIGLLGRDRVCCLYKGKVELPSDMHGIVYVPFKDSINETRDKIIKELKEVGYEIKITEQRKEDKKTRERLEKIESEVEKVLNNLGQIRVDEKIGKGYS